MTSNDQFAEKTPDPLLFVTITVLQGLLSTGRATTVHRTHDQAFCDDSPESTDRAERDSR